MLIDMTGCPPLQALAWALDRGPLADALLNGPQFVLVYMTPLTPKHGERAYLTILYHFLELALCAAGVSADKREVSPPPSASKPAVVTAQTIDTQWTDRLLSPGCADEEAHIKKKGRLSEHAGGSGALLRAWLTKQALIVGLTALQVKKGLGSGTVLLDDAFLFSRRLGGGICRPPLKCSWQGYNIHFLR